MLAGLILPGLPIGNMYFAIWSHNLIVCSSNLCGAFKIGDYCKLSQNQSFRLPMDIDLPFEQ